MFSKTKAICWVDVGLFIIFVASALTSLGLWVLLPGGRSGPEALEVSLAYRLLRGVHEWAGMILLTAVALHLTLHWRWLGVCRQTLLE